MHLGRRLGQEDAAEGEIARYLEEQERQKRREKQPGGMLSEPGDPVALAQARKSPIATPEPWAMGPRQRPSDMPMGANGMGASRPGAVAQQAGAAPPAGATPPATPPAATPTAAQPGAAEPLPPWLSVLMNQQGGAPTAQGASADPAYAGAPPWLAVLAQYLMQQNGGKQ